MKVQGVEITAEQQVAAQAVMVGQFHTSDMHKALIAAGVPNYEYLVERVADTIRQRERRAGKIEPIRGKRGMWRVK